MAAAMHPNLATLHGFEEWRGAPMLVMEFLEGGTLSERLRRGPLPLSDSLMLGIALANGLAVLHRTGILHRDIKPSNIGFSADGVPKLLDFGLAKLRRRGCAGQRRSINVADVDVIGRSRHSRDTCVSLAVGLGRCATMFQRRRLESWL